MAYLKHIALRGCLMHIQSFVPPSLSKLEMTVAEVMMVQVLLIRLGNRPLLLACVTVNKMTKGLRTCPHALQVYMKCCTVSCTFLLRMHMIDL